MQLRVSQDIWSGFSGSLKHRFMEIYQDGQEKYFSFYNFIMYFFLKQRETLSR